MTRPRVAAAGAVLAATLVATGCSGGSDEPSADPTATTTSSSPAVRTQVSWGSVTGRLPKAARQHAAKTVVGLVDGWTEAAYTGGDYPRDDFSDSWPGFTPGAQKEARGDKDLMSNDGIGSRIDGVEPRRSVVRIDALTVHGRPVGMTAHVALAFRTTGDLERVVRVRGRLYLTPTGHGWKVFAYDISKGAV